MLASSGEVDMEALQTLLNHKSPLMTKRYAHLREDALKNSDEKLNQEEISFNQDTFEEKTTVSDNMLTYCLKCVHNKPKKVSQKVF